MGSAVTRIYLDNAATSWPKPAAVYDAVDQYQRSVGAAAGRGAYREAVEVERRLLETRRSVARLIGAADARRVIFTCNGTDSLNLALQGVLRKGDHVVTSVVEHNSTLRPLRYLESHRGVEVTRVRCDSTGTVDVADVRAALRPTTRLIAIVHASNVTGALQPLAEIGQLAKQYGVLFLVDAAQSLGHVPLPVDQLPIDLLAAPGHKGLLGPLGTGILYIAPEIEQQLEPLRQGGTGTVSESDEQPATLPDRYESGNHNVPGLVGLGVGVDFLLKQDLTAMRQRECQLTQRLLDGLGEISGVKLWGPASAMQRVGVVSFQVASYDPQEVAAHLDAAYAIQVRAGFHCAPLLHEALGTSRLGGTARISLGPFTTDTDIDAAVRAVAELAALA